MAVGKWTRELGSTLRRIVLGRLLFVVPARGRSQGSQMLNSSLCHVSPAAHVKSSQCRILYGAFGGGGFFLLRIFATAKRKVNSIASPVTAYCITCLHVIQNETVAEKRSLFGWKCSVRRRYYHKPLCI